MTSLVFAPLGLNTAEEQKATKGTRYAHKKNIFVVAEPVSKFLMIKTFLFLLALVFVEIAKVRFV